MDSAATQKRDGFIVKYNGKEYDIARFLDKHPGGAKILEGVEGESIDFYLSGEKESATDGRIHDHSEVAYGMLEEYALDAEKQSLGANDIDIDKPVMAQLGKISHRYWDWIHEPIDRELRLFESNFVENCSKSEWWMVPAVWLPLVVIFFGYGYYRFSLLLDGQTTAAVSLVLFGAGILAWTLTEYTLHRFVFHFHPDTKSPTQVTFHFIIHGLHHKTPMDKKRLVFPPVPAAMIALVFYFIYSSLLSTPVLFTFGAGKLFGYVGYDMIHYFLHHSTPTGKSYWHRKKLYHNAHHFKNWDSGYGISTGLWDHIFGTVGLPA